MGRKVMTQDPLAHAKVKDLPASLIAMRRAALVARRLAVRTDTAIIVIRHSRIVRVLSGNGFRQHRQYRFPSSERLSQSLYTTSRAR